MRLISKTRFQQDEEYAMFRRKDPQGSLFETSNLLPDEKRERLLNTWAHPFRNQAVPLIDEEAFRDLFCADNGRPNKPVQTVIGTLILKDIWDLTDADALYRLDFDMGWHHALRLLPEEAHCCQKTLHNFRVKLIANDRAQQLFADMTDRIIGVLGIHTDKQRLDSTHILSNIAILTRLGLFCETIRVFLHDVRRTLPEQWAGIPSGLRGRYLKDDGADTNYDDAPKQEARRRLAVAARDLWRLCERFRGDGPAAKLESYGLLQRLLAEQCEVIDTAAQPAADDADHNEEPVPVQIKENRQVAAASLQSPHDPDATYGHKGKGYEVQVAETCGNDGKPEIITYVAVTAAAGSDATQTMPVVQALAERGLQPKELFADTTYGGTDNVIECAALGTELVSPVAGPKMAAEATSAPAPATPAESKTEPMAVANCQTIAEPTVVAATATPAEPNMEPTGAATPSVEAATAPAANCGIEQQAESKSPNAPTKHKTAKAKLLDERRRYQATPEFRARYATRAGIEATNSELKRQHGLGQLRVRGGARVRLAVYFKALACNVKRMLHYVVERARKAVETSAAEVEMGLA